jgi:hypothetical protein
MTPLHKKVTKARALLARGAGRNLSSFVSPLARLRTYRADRGVREFTATAAAPRTDPRSQ